MWQQWPGHADDGQFEGTGMQYQQHTRLKKHFQKKKFWLCLEQQLILPNYTAPNHLKRHPPAKWLRAKTKSFHFFHSTCYRDSFPSLTKMPLPITMVTYGTSSFFPPLPNSQLWRTESSLLGKQSAFCLSCKKPILGKNLALIYLAWARKPRERRDIQRLATKGPPWGTSGTSVMAW